jgi:transcriptional regulator with XRE-family HTH domain
MWLARPKRPYVRQGHLTVGSAPVDRAHHLAQFLAARRARINPADVGISDGDRRRVPGLRREELATLAGVSVDYYTRLEQGRHHQPSEDVLEALARALQLDDDATAYLFALGRTVPSVASPHPGQQESVQPELHDLLDTWTTTPALIHGRWLDVLASNAIGCALTPLAEPGTNIVRSVFLNAEVRERYADPQWVMASAVAYLRASARSDADDPDLTDLVRELSQASEAFRQLWWRHDGLSAMSGDTRFFHPVVGVMRLRYQTFAVEGTDRQTLLVIHAAPSSRDAQALAHLATLTADPDPSTPEPDPPDRASSA